MVTKCHKCGKEWTPKSKNLYVSCPNCLAKVKVNKDDEPYIDMEKKTNIKFTYCGKVLKKYPVAGFDKGDSELIKESLSKNHNVPKDEIEIEMD